VPSWEAVRGRVLLAMIRQLTCGCGADRSALASVGAARSPLLMCRFPPVALCLPVRPGSLAPVGHVRVAVSSVRLRRRRSRVARHGGGALRIDPLVVWTMQESAGCGWSLSRRGRCAAILAA
jgi:hypothetical protein